jgi:hypothetical protein
MSVRSIELLKWLAYSGSSISKIGKEKALMRSVIAISACGAPACGAGQAQTATASVAMRDLIEIVSQQSKTYPGTAEKK